MTESAKHSSISIIMPALNEEGNIQAAISNVIGAVTKYFNDYEIIVINDGSTDRTLEIVEENIRRNNKIRVISNSSPRNIGACYNMGRQEAKMEYCLMVHGDNAFSEKTLSGFLSHLSEADFVCGYLINPQVRSWLRRIISRFYTGVLNCMFGRKMKYYNGLQVYRTEWLKTIPIVSTGFGYQAEVLVQALKSGMSYVEAPTEHVERPGGGATKVFKIRNILNVLKTLSLLYKLR
jgi:glycosyltransferase involved in cell wall biosynthesis